GGRSVERIRDCIVSFHEHRTAARNTADDFNVVLSYGISVDFVAVALERTDDDGRIRERPAPQPHCGFCSASCHVFSQNLIKCHLGEDRYFRWQDDFPIVVLPTGSETGCTPNCSGYRMCIEAEHHH